MKRLVSVVWMERAADGTAAGAHLRGTLARLDALPVEVSGIIADRHSEDGRESYARKIWRLIRLSAQGMREARRDRVLVARYHPLMSPVVIWWRLRGGGVILSVQGTLDSASDNEYPWLKGSRLYRKLAAAPAKMAHGLIAGAPTIERHVREEMLGKTATLVSIPNGVFVDDIQRSRETDRPMAKPYAVFVGNLAKWQGIDTLVSAFRSDSWPEGLALVVVGDGSERALVEHEDGIHWTGRLPSDEARRWLAHAVCAFSVQRADVEVAKHGYWPFKLIESAAAGVPMICSDAPGLPEAAANLGHAVVVAAHDAEATARAAARLWSSPDLRVDLARRGEERAGRYDWRTGAVALGELIALVSLRVRP
jgi:glycosyltransferase involved in cell wall biosynthesis